MRYYGRREKLRKQAVSGRGSVAPVFPDQLRLSEGMSIRELAAEIEARQMYQEQEIDAVAPATFARGDNMHNYLKKIARLAQEGKIPTNRGLNDLTIAHDGWCHIYRGGDCNCDPDIEVRRGVSVNEALERQAASIADFETRVRNLMC